MKYNFRLQRLFSGLDDRDSILSYDVWLKSLSIQLIRASRQTTTEPTTLIRYFLNQVETIADLQEPTKLPPFARNLTIQITNLTDTKSATLARFLLPLLLAPTNEEKLPRPTCTTRICRAIVEEPRGDADSALKFTGGLLLAIPLTAKIFNLIDPTVLRVKLRHPDQQVQLLLPRTCDLKLHNLENKDYRLRTSVLLSHQVWMESCNVEISLALLVVKSLDDSCVIDICKPTKVAIAPKPVKRSTTTSI